MQKRVMNKNFFNHIIYLPKLIEKRCLATFMCYTKKLADTYFHSALADK